MYTASKSEDVWTSLLLHERGWRSVYIPDELAVGDAPDTIEGFTKQQQRWATGGFEILMTHNPLSPRRRLTPDQRIMYLVTSTHYLAGIAPLLLLLVPPLEIFFDLRPVTMDLGLGTWLLYYAGFYVMQIVLAFFTLGSFRWECLLLSTVSFPIYTRALFNVITGKDTTWHVTGGKHRVASPFAFMVPQVLLFTFLLPTSFVAIWRDINHSQLTLATIWNITNTIILGAFIGAAFRELARRRRPVAEARDRTDSRAGPAHGHRAPRRHSCRGAHPRQPRAGRFHRDPGGLVMTWTQRLRLFGGIVAVLALTAVLALVFNQRQAQALSTTGQVVSAQASVGAAYGGVVTKTDAGDGDEVKKGQTLFTVNSPDLQRDLKQGLKVTSTDAFDVDTTASTVTYKALADGRLSDVKAQTGGFIQNGANLATITSDGSQYALADFVLSPARLRADRQGRRGQPAAARRPQRSRARSSPSR